MSDTPESNDVEGAGVSRRRLQGGDDAANAPRVTCKMSDGIVDDRAGKDESFKKESITYLKHYKTRGGEDDWLGAAEYPERILDTDLDSQDKFLWKGHFGEYVRCDIFNDGDGRMVVGETMFTTRNLIQYCTDKAAVGDTKPGECCVSTVSGGFCVAISKLVTPGLSRGEFSEDDPDSFKPLHVALQSPPQVYFHRPKACDFGYCTNGDAHSSVPLPPPPPPFDLPPRPMMPDYPILPPGADLSMYRESTGDDDARVGSTG